MQLLRGSGPEKIDRLSKVAMLILALLLIVLVAWILLGDLLSVLGRISGPIVLFIVGALVAYVMIPLVELVQRAVKKRWAAVAGAYLLVFLSLLVLGVLLLNPVISQGRSLTRDLRNPAASSLRQLQTVRGEAATIQAGLKRELHLLNAGQSLPPQLQFGTQRRIAALRRKVRRMPNNESALLRIQVPPSYILRIRRPVDKLASIYAGLVRLPTASQRQTIQQAFSQSALATSVAADTYKRARGTPVLLLKAQTWLDKRGLPVDLHDKFGEALKEVSRQLSSILNHALDISLRAGNLLVETILVLLISVYFISDGPRFVNWSIRRAPERWRPRVRFFASSLDEVMGTQLRTGVVMALAAALVQTAGAVIFGVPFAGVIFLSTFFLSLVPIIGPIILPFPPLIIALIFTPLRTAILFFIWVMVMEQLLRNVIGPRVVSRSFKIHPLEAMAAAMVGYPIGGFLGSFFAVPIVAFVHIVIDQAIRSGDIVPPGGDEMTDPSSSVTGSS